MYSLSYPVFFHNNPDRSPFCLPCSYCKFCLFFFKCSLPFMNMNFSDCNNFLFPVFYLFFCRFLLFSFLFFCRFFFPVFCLFLNLFLYGFHFISSINSFPLAVSFLPGLFSLVPLMLFIDSVNPALSAC